MLVRAGRMPRRYFVGASKPVTTIDQVMKRYYQSRAHRLQIQNDIVIAMFIELLEKVLSTSESEGLNQLMPFAEAQREAFQKLLEKEII